MRYKEFFVAGTGLFEIVNAVAPDVFTAVFPDCTFEEIDALCLFKYGERIVYPSLTQDNCLQVITAYVAVRGRAWKRQAETMFAEYSAITPNKTVTTTTEQRTYNEQGNSENTNAKKAFNDEMFTDDEQGRQEQTKEHTEGITNEKTTEGTGSTVSDDVGRELSLRQINWQEQIIKALVDEFTMSVY